MTIMWAWGRFKNNYGVIDVGWGPVIIGQGIVYAIFGENNPVKLFVVGVGIVWALRLAVYIFFTRILPNHPEDKRYVEFRKDYGNKVHSKFYTNVFLLQGGLALFVSIPFLIVSLKAFEEFSILVWIGCAISLLGILFEAIADLQLKNFVHDPSNKGKVCNIGLWKYSRHPNYFFEWIVWVGVGIATLAVPEIGFLGLITPIFMYLLLVYVSGVPLAEKQSLKSKGKLFEEYQKTTNAFFPWFPKKG